MIKYIKYVIDNVWFNYYYRWLFGADISIFDNCSWKAFKKNKEER